MYTWHREHQSSVKSDLAICKVTAISDHLQLTVSGLVVKTVSFMMQQYFNVKPFLSQLWRLLEMADWKANNLGCGAFCASCSETVTPYHFIQV